MAEIFAFPGPEGRDELALQGSIMEYLMDNGFARAPAQKLSAEIMADFVEFEKILLAPKFEFITRDNDEHRLALDVADTAAHQAKRAWLQQRLLQTVRRR